MPSYSASVRSHSRSQRDSDFEREGGVTAVACTRGQEGVKGLCALPLQSFQLPHRRLHFFSLLSLERLRWIAPQRRRDRRASYALRRLLWCRVLVWYCSHLAIPFALILREGTCHKGLLGNLSDKTGAFGQPWDELFPCVIFSFAA